MTSCPLPLIIQTVIVCIVLVCFLAGEGHWTLPLAGTRTAKCEGCSQSVCVRMCVPAQRRKAVSRYQPPLQDSVWKPLNCALNK